MTIRTAGEGDIPGIIDLLRKSLGESLLPKSETYWNWKHRENPFGKSLVLLAEEDGNIVGVRAFMRWRWMNGDRQYEALRAVDTATHPRNQGKGVFRTLTLKLVDECAAAGLHFIFNTPNKYSLPGYLSMGWVEAGRQRVRIGPTAGVVLVWSGLRKAKILEPGVAFEVAAMDQFATKLGHLVNAHNQEIAGMLVTSLSFTYLRWRYEQVPVVRYYWLNDLDKDASFCLFFRVKQTRFGTEARITDFLVSTARLNRAFLLDQLRGLKSAVDYISAEGFTPAVNRLLSLAGFTPALPVGPRVTLRNLNLEKSSFLSNFDLWRPTLGDLELF